MKVRSVQLVCIIILLSSMRMAGASVLPGGEYGIGGRYVGSVLCQDCAGVWTTITLIHTGDDWRSGSGTLVMIERFTGRSPRILNPDRGFRLKAVTSESGGDVHRGTGSTLILALPVESLAAYHTVWTMKPPAVQCITVHTVTGSADGMPLRATFC
jgi:hypothetical protein